LAFEAAARHRGFVNLITSIAQRGGVARPLESTCHVRIACGELASVTPGFNGRWLT